MPHWTRPGPQPDHRRMTEPVPSADRDAVLAFVCAAQADPATATAFLGEQPDGIAAELDGLAQPWLAAARVLVENGRIVGAATVEWDVEVGRAWVYGPWAAPDRFAALGEPLLQATAAQAPAGIELEVCGDVRHVGLAALADRLGFTPTPVNHALEIAADAVAAWPTTHGVRDATPADLPALAALHEAEFVGAYATTAQLLTRHTTVVVERAGAVVGYAAGQLQDDGQAYVDFMAVAPEHRGAGLGAALLGDLGRRLVAAGQPTTLHLTVEDARVPARRLYEGLGMRLALSLRAYRGRLTA